MAVFIDRFFSSSAMGYTIFMDENGDAQGNYTLLALDTQQNITGKHSRKSEAL